MIIDDKKRCSQCHTLLATSEFTVSRKNKDGLCHRCKICAKKYAAEFRNRGALYTSYVERLLPIDGARLSGDGERLEVKCFHCGKYFIPNNGSAKSRVACINNPLLGQSNFYCSTDCKKLSPSFCKRSNERGAKRALRRSKTHKISKTDIKNSSKDLYRRMCKLIAEIEEIKSKLSVYI